MRYVLACLTLLIYSSCTPVYAQEGKEVRRYFTKVFEGAVSMISDEIQYDSSKEIIGFDPDDYYITTDISQVAIAQREGRIFVNPNIHELPDGAYTFILTSLGNLELGQIENDLEIGVKHFQLAHGRAVWAAGEITKINGQFRISIMSGTFSRHLKRMPGYSEADTMKKLKAAFKDLWGIDVEVETVTLYADPQKIEIGILLKYCAHPEFYKFHTRNLCSQFKSLEEAQCALKTQNN